ncbi:MAG: reverse gyrase, partial [Thermoproteota archaeon]
MKVTPVIPAVYRGLCPGCGGDLRVHEGGCKCGVETEYEKIEEMASELYSLFRDCVGSDPWQIQRVWGKRVVMRQSFAALAPTGVGKTAFGLVAALYHPLKGWGKSIVIVPTVLLVSQAERLLRGYVENSARWWGGEGPDILSYRSSASRAEREESLSRIEAGEFDVLVITSQFLARHHNLLRGDGVGFVFVDDVDSFLKASRNVDRLLEVIGFSAEEVERALRDPTYRPEKRPDTVLMLSTATGKPGRRAALFRRLMGFDVGVIREGALRNVEDVVVGEKSVKRLSKILEMCGSGGLLFVPRSAEAEEALRAAEMAGLKAQVVVGSEEEAIELFKSGEVDLLIGAARPYGVLVRGINLPERIRYSVFYGAPRFEVGLSSVEDMSEGAVSSILSVLSASLGARARGLAVRIRRGDEEALSRGRELIREVLGDRERLEAAAKSAGVIVEVEPEPKIVIPDVRTYIQGSGRTSRLYPGGITRGISFLLEEDPLKTAFLRRASVYEVEFKDVEEVNVEEVLREVDEDRRRVREAWKHPKKVRGLIRTAVFVVESPNKARTIARFFGRPTKRSIDGIPSYEVLTGDLLLTIVATGGHIVDLTTEGGFHGVEVSDGMYVPVFVTRKRCIKCGHQFTDYDRCPQCGSTEIFDSRVVVDVLRKLAVEGEVLIIGTDPDTEGEKIAWDVAQLAGFLAREVWRAEFHEVTKRAIGEALRNLHEIDEKRVRAQIVRRVEDRWIGFELSTLLQRVFGKKNLSAGRAQTPTLGWIIEAYSKSRKRKKVWIVAGDGFSLRTEEELPTGVTRAVVREVSSSVEEVPPPPPFTTDSMLREASRVLKMEAYRAMSIAQDLFELGLITYHRTDSPRVSDAGLRVAREVLGEEFTPRRWGEGGAHEGIRPTKPISREELTAYVREGILPVGDRLRREHLALYHLIFSRFMASQAPTARVEVKEYELSIGERRLTLTRRTEAVEPGWLRWYPYGLRIEGPLPTGEAEVRVAVRKVPE